METLHLLLKTHILDLVYFYPRCNLLLAADASQYDDKAEDWDEWCICKKAYIGDEDGMIACNNTYCPNGIWFHFKCMDMTRETVPATGMQWFCSVHCRADNLVPLQMHGHDKGNVAYHWSAVVLQRTVSRR